LAKPLEIFSIFKDVKFRLQYLKNPEYSEDENPETESLPVKISLHDWAFVDRFECRGCYVYLYN
ncbi:unnamed protein product, partial [Allacma fusca]